MKNKKKTEWKRKCSNCEKELSYILKKNRDKANRERWLCYNCAKVGRPKKYNGNEIWKRKCSECGEEIFYKIKSQFNEADRKNRKCQKCGCSWAKGQTKENNEKIMRISINNKKTWKEKFDNGYDVWNKGLTKETNEILKKMGEKHKGFRQLEETKNLIGQTSTERQTNPEFMKFFNKRVQEGMEKSGARKKWYNTMVERGYFTPKELLSDLEIYRREVRKYTEKNDLTILENSNKRARMGIEGAYHLDHKFSISRGFVENILPWIIGHNENLEFIPSMENQKKKNKCSITKEELFTQIKQNQKYAKIMEGNK